MQNSLKLFLLLAIQIGLWSCVNKKTDSYVPGKNSFNKGWEFIKDVDADIAELATSKSLQWDQVSLPHTAQIEPLVIKGDQWQGTCYYKKNFKINKELAAKHLGLYFEGAMQVSEVYLNGKLLKKHLGGYLPFYVDLTNEVSANSENCLIVKLNNDNNPLVPPGKGIDVLDFNYYSGLYRNVWLYVKNPLHISNEFEVDHVAAGGVFVTYKNVSKNNATINVAVDMKNDAPNNQAFKIQTELYKGDQFIQSITSPEESIKARSTSIVNNKLEVENPELWSPNSPSLYKLIVKTLSNGQEIDQRSINIGIRSFEITAKDGFKINGEKLKLRGTNRHQEYPYIGYALSDNANYRDAYKIKQAGFNFVRLSHYPQSQSFINACDELGILVMDAIPGWQFFGNKEFQDNALKDIRRMVRVDRNHPSVIIWEASLNESLMTNEFMTKSHLIVHDEYPGTNVYTSGWLDYAYDVFIPARQHAKPPVYWNDYKKDTPLCIAEYGDWEYYAQNAGFNQKAFQDLSDEERTSRQLRAYGQKRLAQQALNYQESHNSNLQGNAIGDANWLMYDYNRGYTNDLESSGIMDIFRLPKFAFYFYQSQANIGESSLKDFAQPMVAIANYYNDPSFLNIKVYSNCDEVELFVNNKSLGKQKPDQDRNSTHLPHPPFTFQLEAFTPGQIEAKGYVNGKEVAQTIQKTPGEAKSLKLWIDESGKKLQSGCNDIVFVYAAVVDENGTINPLAENNIKYAVSGNVELIGSNPVNAEAGIATILIKAGEKPGNITITASSQGLDSGNLEVTIE